EGLLAPPEKMEAVERAHAGEGYISLAVFKRTGEIHGRRVHAHALALVHGYGPGKAERYLLYGCAHLAALFKRPFCRSDYLSISVMGFYEGMVGTLLKSYDGAERAVHVPGCRIVFRAHHDGAFFKDEGLRRQAAALEAFYKDRTAHARHDVAVRGAF